jgi:putative NAD(P)-binding protein
MLFPPRPATSDARRIELLRLFAVDGYTNVFILGSHARYVTVYNQQVRALNLVAALAKTGRLSACSRVGIVGGGIAGLTAAAAAAQAGSGHVEVFENEPSLMRLQWNSEKRFIHPHIYDWPQSIALEDRADLPVMQWQAKMASKVAVDLLKEFEAAQQSCGTRLRDPSVVKSVELKNGARPTLIVDGQPREFDVVILAVGFGRDDSPPWTHGYWTDDDIGDVELEKQPRTWLISGSGDGALTDLMRLCILNFQHEAVLEAVDAATREKVGHRLTDADRSAPDADARRDAFLDAAKEVDEALKAKLQFRDVGPVFLNADATTLFEGGSSVLNRLITAWLLHNDRFKIVSGRIEKEPPVVDGRIHVGLAGAEVVDRLLIRHGPRSPYDTQAWLAGVAAATQEKREAWRSVRQFEDWTREPLYDDDVPFTEIAKTLRVDFGDRIGCVIVVGATGTCTLQERSLHSRIEEVLERLVKLKATGGRQIAPTPVVIDVKDALASPAEYERAVRALCTSDIAVFDLTNHESAVMLLLGIRAAVRRGITATVTVAEDDDPPFNIASLNPVILDEDYVENQTRALETAFATMAAIPDYYLDLPVYDAVRSVGADHVTRTPDKEILVLRWFDKTYSRVVAKGLIRDRLKTRWPDTTVVTTLDSRSPQLVEQRLYAAIRRDQLCIADWTAARANVFFEIGVRLAVSPQHPMFILCEDPPPTYDASSAWPEQDPWLPALERLFGVTRFAINAHEDLKKRIRTDSPQPDALLSPGRTYAVVVETIEQVREPGGETLEQWLLRHSDKLAGPAGIEEGDVPVLYAEALKEQVRDAAAERTLAAWYYLAGRNKVFERMANGTIDGNDPVFAKLKAVGAKFTGQARNASAELKTIADELKESLRRMSKYQRGERDGGRPQ